MRVWRIPARCLDDRRLLGQHSEAHVLMSVLEKDANGEAAGWIATPQAQLWIGKRSAIIDYHDNILLPEMRRRGWPSGSLKHHASPMPGEDTLPESERYFIFWSCVTWDQILYDCRHLIEKHRNDAEMVRLAKRHGVKTRIIKPRGHSAKSIVYVFHLSISRVYNIPLTDTETLQRTALRLTRERMLDPPKLKLAA